MRSATLSPVLLVASALAFGGACEQSLDGACNDDPTKCEGDVADSELGPPRIYVDPPFGVGFECVSVGCEETRSFRVENRGGGEVAIRLIRLSVDTSGDVDIALAGEEGAATPDFPTTPKPLLLKTGEAFEVVVRYTPTDAVPDDGELWIDWYDGALAPEDAAADRVKMPITTRVLGDAVALLETPELNFGYVPLGETVTLPVKITNDTEGSAVLSLEVPVFDPASAPQFSLDPAPTSTLFVNPGETAVVPVSFTPTDVDWYGGVLYLPTNDGARPQLVVSLLGTAIQEPYFAVLQPNNWTVDFGQVRVGTTGTRQVKIRNLGGQPLSVTAQLPSGADLGFSTPIPLGTPLPTVAPLGFVTFDVSSTPTLGGDIAGEMRFSTNDPTLPEDRLDLRVYGVAPEGIVTPPSLAFGNIAQGWTSEAQTVYISNGGTGELTISSVSFELGSSSQVRLAEQPTLPVKLRAGDEPLAISVFVQALTIGSANAVLLVATDGIEQPTLRVNVTANVVTCEQACPVTNGAPTCAAGRCEIASCLPRFHDADMSFDSGCECGEDTTPQGNVDVGDFCSSGANVGPIHDRDSPRSVEREGTLHSADDVDLYYFRAIDNSEFDFNDDYGVRVELLEAPAGLEFCVRLTDAGAGCGGENQRQCGLRTYNGPGNGSGSDDEDVTVWVRWAPDASPQCGTYRIRFRADVG